MNEPVRVMLVTPSLDVGGAERVIATLANAFDAAGARVALVLATRPGALAASLRTGVDVVVLDRPRIRSALPAIVRRIRAASPDVVLSSHTHVNLALCVARPRFPSRTRLVLREPQLPPERDRPGDRVTRILQRALYRRADHVLASSTMLQQHLRCLTATPVSLLANPVDTEVIRSMGTPDPQRDGAGRLFVTLSRLSPEKGLDDLLEAFAESADAEDRLLMIGDGPDRAPLEATVARLKLGSRVSFAGRVDRPWPMVAAADALVLPSHYEGMPNAVLEALALGTPVVATDDVRGLADLEASLAAAGESAALAIVPRDHLGEALSRTRRLPLGETPRPSLLPEAHEPSRAVELILRSATR